MTVFFKPGIIASIVQQTILFLFVTVPMLLVGVLVIFAHAVLHRVAGHCLYYDLFVRFKDFIFEHGKEHGNIRR